MDITQQRLISYVRAMNAKDEKPTDFQRTWDDQPVTPEPPFGATVVVYRFNSNGAEFLVLHRGQRGANFEGDWAWTPPAGARHPGEALEACAQRELYEEAGLKLEPRRVDIGDERWCLFAVEKPPEMSVRLIDAEHDRFEWLPLADAITRCQPAFIGENIAKVAQALGLASNHGLHSTDH